MLSSVSLPLVTHDVITGLGFNILLRVDDVLIYQWVFLSSHHAMKQFEYRTVLFRSIK